MGIGLVSDDSGGGENCDRWAVSGSGVQTVADNATPTFIATTFWIKAEEWKGSIREAIDFAMDEQEDDCEE